MVKPKREIFHRPANVDRVIFNFRQIEYPEEYLTGVLESLGFSKLKLKPAELIRYCADNSLIGKADYFLKSDINDAPDQINCSLVSAWLYSMIGIELPTLSIQQYQFGEPIHTAFDLCSLRVGDLLFKSGPKNYWDKEDPGKQIGHGGIIIDVDSKEGMVCHAVDGKGVVAVSINDFIRNGTAFVGACRIVRDLRNWTVLDLPPEDEQIKTRIKTSDDIRWRLYESMPY